MNIILLAIFAAAVIATLLTTTTTIVQVQAGGPGCPDPGYCTCNAASGVMTDHAMDPPFNKINNGCTEDWEGELEEEQEEQEEQEENGQ
jgi:hypothetical protein